uniref:Uncharacterized protein n=1 Tax=Oryza meridionalis TaxID=40149 RepID=A0A0E0ETB6_9ORYZ
MALSRPPPSCSRRRRPPAAACQEGSLEEQHHQVLHGLVVLVRIGTLAELVHDGILRVDLHGLLARHVAGHAGVPKSLGLHDPLHTLELLLEFLLPLLLVLALIKLQTFLGGRDELLALKLLKLANSTLELLLEFLLPLLLVLALIKLQTFLGGRDELLALKLLKLANSVLINGINHQENRRDKKQNKRYS